VRRSRPSDEPVDYRKTSDPTRLLVLSQIVLSMQLSFAMAPLLHFVDSRRLMSEYVVGREREDRQLGAGAADPDSQRGLDLRDADLTSGISQAVAITPIEALPPSPLPAAHRPATRRPAH